MRNNADYTVRPHQKTRVYIVDHHPMVRHGLSAVISDEDDLEVCGYADDSDTALREMVKLKPDVAIVDLSLDRGFGLMKSIRASHLKTRCCAFSLKEEPEDARRALQAGAYGCVMQHDPGSVLEAIRKIGRGQRVISANLKLPPVASGTAGGDGVLGKLTERERAIVKMIGQGEVTSEIATRLHLSQQAVRRARMILQRKLNLANGRELLQFCVEKNADK